MVERKNNLMTKSIPAFVYYLKFDLNNKKRFYAEFSISSPRYIVEKIQKLKIQKNLIIMNLIKKKFFSTIDVENEDDMIEKYPNLRKLIKQKSNFKDESEWENTFKEEIKNILFERAKEKGYLNKNQKRFQKWHSILGNCWIDEILEENNGDEDED